MHLTGAEFWMLELLSLRKGGPITNKMFLTHLYGDDEEPGAKIIDVFIRNLRKNVAAATNGANYIQTIRGREHMLRDPDIETTVAV
jgi:two-component system cell cycle response regulator CtrA